MSMQRHVAPAVPLRGGLPEASLLQAPNLYVCRCIMNVYTEMRKGRNTHIHISIHAYTYAVYIDICTYVHTYLHICMWSVLWGWPEDSELTYQVHPSSVCLLVCRGLYSGNPEGGPI